MLNPTDTVNDLPEAPRAAQQAVVETDAGAGHAPAGDTASTDGALDAMTRERDEYYDRLLRKTAEFDNYRKRSERERREQAEYAAADVLGDLLPLVDDLERALQAATDSADAYRKGVELIHRQMLELLRRHGVTAIEAAGQDFDPHLHQAVAHEEAPGHRDGEVVEQFCRGYKLRDRLLRPAMVKVAKA
jgi:molecular chaperone GrpE